MHATQTPLETPGMSVLAKGYDPGITPKFDAPWMDVFKTLGGQIIGTVIAALVVVVVIAAVLWVVSKLGGSGAGQTMGLKALLIAMVAAAIIGSAGGAIAWFSGFQLFG